MLKKVSLVLMTTLYLVAGINHFVNPQIYYAIIPRYLPWPVFINSVSGIVEIISGLLLIPKATRYIGSMLIIILLIAFIPAHIYMIQKNDCAGAGLCIPLWVAWLRLVPIQFLLIYWAWTNRK